MLVFFVSYHGKMDILPLTLARLKARVLAPWPLGVQVVQARGVLQQLWNVELLGLGKHLGGWAPMVDRPLRSDCRATWDPGPEMCFFVA